MLSKLAWALRWATAAAIVFTLATWIVAVAFALLGFKRTAEKVNEVVLYALPLDATLLGLLVVVLIVAWLVRTRVEPSRK